MSLRIREELPSGYMERPQEEYSRSGWERMQSRPRFRWLVEQSSRIATAAWESLSGEPLLDDNAPIVAHEPEPAQLSNEELLEQWKQRRRREEARLRPLIQIAPGRELDVSEYGRYRLEQSDWLTMEIGPGKYPNGITGRGFKGKSAYIGIENYSFPEYSDEADAAFKELCELRPDENIFLRADPTFGRYYPKEKNAYYDFPDATADEIYISQVYDKPGFDLMNDDEEFMTNEVARLLKPGSKALIFDYDRNLENILGWLNGAGLELRAVVREEIVDPMTGELTFSPGELREAQTELDCAEGNLIVIAEKPEDWTRASASRIHAPSYPAPASR